MRRKANILLLGIIMFNLNIVNAQDYILRGTEKNDSLLYYNNKFKTDYKLIEPIYSKYYKFRNKTTYNKNGAPLLAEYGVIDNSNNIIFQPTFEIIRKLGNNGLLYLVSTEIGKGIIYNLKTKDTIFKGINELFSYEKESLFVFDQNNLFGVINDKNEKVILFDYDKIEYFNNNFFLLKNGTLSNLLLQNSIKNVKKFNIKSSLINVEHFNKKHSIYDLKYNPLVISKDEIFPFTTTIFQVKDKNKNYIQFPDKYIQILKFTNSTQDGDYIWIFKQKEVDIYDLKGDLKYNFKNLKTYDNGNILESEYSRIKSLMK